MVALIDHQKPHLLHAQVAELKSILEFFRGHHSDLAPLHAPHIADIVLAYDAANNEVKPPQRVVVA